MNYAKAKQIASTIYQDGVLVMPYHQMTNEQKRIIDMQETGEWSELFEDAMRMEQINKPLISPMSDEDHTVNSYVSIYSKDLTEEEFNRRFKR